MTEFKTGQLELDNTNEQELSFTQAIKQVINKYSMENESNTPDWILANALCGFLDTLNDAIAERDVWYGVHLEPGNGYFGPLGTL